MTLPDKLPRPTVDYFLFLVASRIAGRTTPDDEPPRLATEEEALAFIDAQDARATTDIVTPEDEQAFIEAFGTRTPEFIAQWAPIGSLIDEALEVGHDVGAFFQAENGQPVFVHDPAWWIPAEQRVQFVTLCRFLQANGEYLNGLRYPAATIIGRAEAWQLHQDGHGRQAEPTRRRRLAGT